MSPASALLRLDPWTVYGDVADSGETPFSVRIAVPDIGVLPPEGRYLGTLRYEAGPMPARLTVRPRQPGNDDGMRWVSVELEIPMPIRADARVAVVFEAMEAT
jgi:hypothetical protein